MVVLECELLPEGVVVLGLEDVLLSGMAVVGTCNTTSNSAHDTPASSVDSWGPSIAVCDAACNALSAATVLPKAGDAEEGEGETEP
jgi:hypothetical protein